MLHRSELRRLLSKILFGLFALLLLNGIVFRHAHRLADGRIITHAHPFWPDGKGPLQANTHSAGELALLDGLSNPLLTLSPSLTFCFVAAVVGFVFNLVFIESPLRAVPLRGYRLRGPPTGPVF